MSTPAATEPALADALQTLLRAPFGDVLTLLGQSVAGPLLAPLLAEACALAVQRELDRREQYGAARAMLTDDPLPPEEDEITATVAARLLRVNLSNTLLTQMRRGDKELEACMIPGKEEGKARRFSRAKILALKVRRGL